MRDLVVRGALVAGARSGQRAVNGQQPPRQQAPEEVAARRIHAAVAGASARLCRMWAWLPYAVSWRPLNRSSYRKHAGQTRFKHSGPREARVSRPPMRTNGSIATLSTACQSAGADAISRGCGKKLWHRKGRASSTRRLRPRGGWNSSYELPGTGSNQTHRGMLGLGTLEVSRGEFTLRDMAIRQKGRSLPIMTQKTRGPIFEVCGQMGR